MPFDEAFLDVFATIREALLQLPSSIKVTRADNPTIGNAIIADILDGIANADLVIADLTWQKPNVFYELGICHVAKDDVILISQKGEDLPFDVQHLRCLEYEASSAGLSSLSLKLQKSVRELLDARNRNQMGEVDRMKQIGRVGALRVADWFSARLGVLEAIAEWPELQRNDVAGHESALSKIATVLQEFSGGVYILDENGKVLSSSPDIRGEKYGHREYFRLCKSRLKSVVSNSFDSANREQPIVVVAVPRFDSNGTFLGILDAVLDIYASPLDAVIQPVVMNPPTRTDAQLLLVDQRRVVIASNTPDLAGKNVGGHPVIGTLLGSQEFPSSEEIAGFYGQYAAAAFTVNHTPFKLISVGGLMILP
ncbi:MAG TPA: hypothetical protein VGS07_15090 [Thermoanaerobaculia bacterium]|jgi:hypothetical protein|nr:hypothetical protein [Thermoanaerobaculia bacterium]